MKRNNATIRTVAQRAGVSIATVSHVLNRSRYVSNELIAKVEKAIEELEYSPEKHRRAHNGSTKLISLIVPDSSQPLMAALSRCIEDILFLNNYGVIVSNTLYDINREANILEVVRSKMINGILIIPSTNNLIHIDDFLKTRVPIIAIDREILNADIDCVRTDNQIAGHMSAEHMLKLGHTVIGFIDRPTDQSHSVDRKEGFMKALSAHNLTIHHDLFVRTQGFRFKDGEEATERMLSVTPRPTAIVAINDDLAIGAMNKVLQLGLRIPQDVSVMGYGNTPYGEEYRPSLTTIDYPCEEIAQKVCTLLLERIKNAVSGEKKQKKVILEHRLIVRDSTSRQSG